MKNILLISSYLLRYLIGAFIIFVGYWKGFGPIPALTEHHAWVAGFPDWFARTIGYLEIISGIIIILPNKFNPRPYLLNIACLWLAFNQPVSSAVHYVRGELDSLPQNALIVAILLAIILIENKRKNLAQ